MQMNILSIIQVHVIAGLLGRIVIQRQKHEIWSDKAEIQNGM